MTDPNEFYNREDLWAWPEEIFDNQPMRMEPYYVLMELPDRRRIEVLADFALHAGRSREHDRMDGRPE